MIENTDLFNSHGSEKPKKPNPSESGSNIVPIPHLPNNAKSGEILMAVFSIIEMSERLSPFAIWDFSNVKFLHPFLIGALSIYKDSCGYKIEEINIPSQLAVQFNILHYNNPLLFSSNSYDNIILSEVINSEKLPICKFHRAYPKIDSLQSNLLKKFQNQISGRAYGWVPTMALSYLISELICNIQEHSHSSYGYLMMQCPDIDDCITICIADNGISIHGSFQDKGREEYMRLIGSDHAEALRYSIKGISTKNLPGNESRGYGLSTNLDMVVNGLSGQFLLISGNAFYRADAEGEQFINLPTGMNWDGTIIMVRIPLKQNNNFNVYKYIE